MQAVRADGEWQGFEMVLPLDSGLNATFVMDFQYTPHFHVGGAAAGDVDGDGFSDLVLLRGNNSPRLYLNQGDGSYDDATAGAGLSGIGGIVNGAILADINGDGHLDLLLGGVSQANIPEGPHTPMRVFLNDGSGQFTDHTATSNLIAPTNSLGVPFESHSMALADVDRDGLLDLMIAYWHQGEGSASGHLWRNTGDAVFEDISELSGIGGFYSGDDSLFNFTPNFADLNDDGWADLVISADFGNSRVFLNNGDGTFADATQRGLEGVPDVITDENGMGATVGDFDNDGDFDWFVTSIWEDTAESRPYGTSGNRLYLNDGSGQFTDATDAASLREGDWGWGSCAADFNNDGWLDILMVNGYQTHQPRFLGNPARLFINNGDGSFSDRAVVMGINSTGQGRALTCFDHDNDGWIDVVIQNSHAMGETSVQPQLFRNLGGANHRWLTVELEGPGANRYAVGARITLQSGELTQIREIRAGSNFLSAEPLLAHFGLGAATSVDNLQVRWPDGRVSTWKDLETNRIVKFRYGTLFQDDFDE